MEVYVKYLDMRGSNGNMAAQAMFSTLMLSQGIVTPGDPGQLSLARSSVPVEALSALGAKDDELPKTFLNYFLFDSNFNQVDGGFAQVSNAAAITQENPTGEHEKLTLEIEVTEPGYLLTNLSHDKAENVDVYFLARQRVNLSAAGGDNYKVIHGHGYIV